jgi:hypothetical protein
MSYLYEKYFTSDLDFINVDMTLVNKLGFNGSTKFSLFGNLNYLRSKNLIDARMTLGRPYPYKIKISIQGISTYENIIDTSIEKIKDSDIDKSEKDKIEEIRMESDKTIRLKKFRDFVGNNSKIIELAINIFKSIILGT